MPTTAAQNRVCAESAFRPSLRAMIFEFGVAFVTWKITSAAFEFDGDDVEFALVMSAPRLRVNVNADNRFTVNQPFRFHIELQRERHSTIVKVSARRYGAMPHLLSN